MCDNLATIVAIEILAACQGIDFRRPLKTSDSLHSVYKKIRKQVEFYEEDRPFHEDIQRVKLLILAGELNAS